MNLGELPDCNGVPVTVLLTMNIDQLESRTGIVTTAHGGSLTVEQVIRMGTAAGIVPVVFTDSGGVLAYGRRRRVASLGQRYALYARDLRCSHAGCTQPGAWCQVDHTLPWEHGGRTDLNGLCLLCPYHNYWLRKQGWHIRITDDIPHTIPPTWIDPEQKPRKNPQPERHPLRT